MAIFYAVEQGLIIQKEGERLIAKKDNKIIKFLHFHNLEQLILIGRIGLTPAVIFELLKRGIDTVFLSYSGRYLGRLSSIGGKNIELRFRQYESLKDELFKLNLAKKIVRGKIENQRLFLRRINRKGLGLEDTILKLRVFSEKVKEGSSLDEIRGIEGTTSRVYFDAYAKGLLGAGIGFDKRERRPPKDPANALLSLGYTLLFSHVFSVVNMVGLDPYIGFFHAINYGKPSLALDLMEEWRPIIVDAVVMNAFNLKVIKREDFVVEEEGVCLTRDGWRKFIAQFERKMSEKVKHPHQGIRLTYRGCIEAQARQLVRHIKGEEEYTPAVFR